ncbi:helix-turn-helix domain-containing protein [Enterococcus rivorum]|nr:tetratricopeptide repeat protein [Enterococcus rivorum]MBP2099030.1 tetratricopeptide (TPR) repeat protein [Enterococcus rivorum]
MKVRDSRKKQRLSQKALAEGICTQATISKIENKNRCESLDVFSSVCSKLGLIVSDCLEKSNEQELEKILDDVESLCEQMEHRQAYQLLKKSDINSDLISDDLKIKYLYYKGSTCLLTEFNYKQAMIYLNQGIKIIKKPTIYNLLSMNAIGISYHLQGKMNQAREYHEKAYEMIGQLFVDKLPRVACRLFYNLAKFYSECRDYERSIQLCNQGIELSKELNFTFNVDVLLYEKAYNEYHLNGTIEGYKIAYYFTDFMNHKVLMEIIKKNMKEYNIQL